MSRHNVVASLLLFFLLPTVFWLTTMTMTTPQDVMVMAFMHSTPHSSQRSSRNSRGKKSSIILAGSSSEPPSSSSSSSDQLNIAFVTGNKMKVKEVQMILAESGTTNLTHPESSLVNLRVVTVDLPEIQEVNTHGIAKEKALLGAQLAGGPCLVEDTSLKFHALGGMPGPYIKWFQDRLKSEGLYKILTAYEDKSATAVCTLAFCSAPHADPVLFTGKVEGTIVEPQKGGGFGWDSIFVPNGESRPFSVLSTDEKNQLSHRGDAVRQWSKWLAINRQELLERQNGRKFIGHKGLDFKSNSPEQ